MSKNRLSVNTHLSRHSHDVGAGYTFSLAPGMILPTYFDVLGPGDSVYYRTKSFARMADIVTAFLGEVDLHFDWFFVPLQMIFTPFGGRFAGTNEVLSSSHSSLSSTLENSGRFPNASISFLQSSFDLSGKYLFHRECVGKEITRLLDSFDLNPLALLSYSNLQQTDSSYSGTYPDSDIIGLPSVISPWIPCAYQAIYQRYFRNDDFEKFDISAYNIDSSYNQTSFADPKLFKLRYVTRYDDYFTSSRVSPITSAVNRLQAASVPSESDAFPSEGGKLSQLFEKVNDFLGFYPEGYAYEMKDKTNYNIYPSAYMQNIGSSPDSFVASSVGFNESYTPTAANIRALFAVDKFMRIYGRAKKTYDDQILAHFGIEVPHDVKHDLTHLKHYRLSLTSDPIYATADVSGGSSLGQVGAQSNGALDSGKEKFTAPVHGVFMCVCYAKSKPRYFGTTSKLHQLCDRLQFPQPEFDKLGAQPLYGWEFNPRFLVPSALASTPWQIRCAWQNRYQQFKKKYNRISLTFADPSIYWGAGATPAPANTFSPYVLGRMAFDNEELRVEYNDSGTGQLLPDSHLLNVINFFESPSSLDSVMALSYNGNWSMSYFAAPNSMFDTDPIFIDFFADVNKVSWMSETGEPDL